MPDTPHEPRPVMLVTGGSRGIGAAVCRRAATAGYDVVVNYATNAAAAEQVATDVRAAGARAMLVQADVGTEDDVVRMFRAVDDTWGTIDVLVNNAGIAGGHGTLESVTADSLGRLWAVNLTGAFLCAREASARMRTDRGGRGGSIVNVSSRAALIGGADEWVHYAATKGAMDTMTIGLSRELARVGIRVNAVRPGLIESDFHDHAPPGRLERLRPSVPMQRSGTAEEVAAAVMWLAGPDAGYTTGSFIEVSGGR